MTRPVRSSPIQFRFLAPVSFGPVRRKHCQSQPQKRDPAKATKPTNLHSTPDRAKLLVRALKRATKPTKRTTWSVLGLHNLTHEPNVQGDCSHSPRRLVFRRWQLILFLNRHLSR